ncbi:hypothetical protein Anapl_04197 [Anas platyrhynchos]|uniref:Uncharacterized protein n=1 Tax=Anas platyrhynchos TaxID=8839 RepID=R0LBT4_ANAPL|nr:hypothetical protein Anapl_04197 [Anas platyrhynchos]
MQTFPCCAPADADFSISARGFFTLWLANTHSKSDVSSWALSRYSDYIYTSRFLEPSGFGVAALTTGDAKGEEMYRKGAEGKEETTERRFTTGALRDTQPHLAMRDFGERFGVTPAVRVVSFKEWRGPKTASLGLDVLADALMVVVVVVRAASRRVKGRNAVKIEDKILPVAHRGRVMLVARQSHCKRRREEELFRNQPPGAGNLGAPRSSLFRGTGEEPKKWPARGRRRFAPPLPQKQPADTPVLQMQSTESLRALDKPVHAGQDGTLLAHNLAGGCIEHFFSALSVPHLAAMLVKGGVIWLSRHHGGTACGLGFLAASPPHSAAPGSYIKQYKNDAAAFSLRCIPAVCSTASPAFEKYTNIELDKTMCLHVVGFQSLVQFLADRSESKRRKQKDVVKPSALPVGKSLQYRFPDCRLAKTHQVNIKNDERVLFGPFPTATKHLPSVAPPPPQHTVVDKASGMVYATIDVPGVVVGWMIAYRVFKHD